MKSVFKYLSLGAVLAGMASCTDLDTEINNRYTELPDNPIAVEGEFNGCYYYLHGWFGRDFNEGVVNQGDEVMGCCFGVGNYFDDGRYLAASIHSLDLDNWRTRIIEGCLQGVNYTNTKILAYGGEDMNDPVVAPLRAIRAYYTFWMMELYGDAPIMARPVEEGKSIDRSPRKEVAEWIESELLEILGQEGGLSKANDLSTYGKPNYWMAAALLVKLYLNWGVYTNDITTVTGDTPNEKLNECIKWCNVIQDCGIFEVGQGYRKKFYPDNGVHIKDFIYALNVDPQTQKDGTTTWYRWFGFKKDGLCRPYCLGWENPKSVAGQTVLTKEAVARFNLPGDERNKIILQGPQYAFDKNYEVTDQPVYIYTVPGNEKTKVGQLTYHTDFDFDDGSIYSLGDEALPKANKANIEKGIALLNIQKGARCFKYPPREEDYTLWDRQQANDGPIFRYADILLTKAECIMRGGTDPKGQTVAELVNEVRRCSGAPDVTGDFTMKDLMDERSREFILEPWRRNDLIRAGMFEDDWGEKNRYKVWDNEEHTQFHWVEREGVKDPNRRLMPIHRGILETNLNWKQNPGYAGL
ncbi:MAG: RagB/SusD family nutrient uptake outer membrane protein [Muribaculaceae bacterium]|nr:RagB/SusD family nutrient uptake outer membrane protein [Muribaculaceae bacterium]